MWRDLGQYGLAVRSLVLLCAAAFGGAGQALAQPQIVDLRIAEQAGLTRLVLEMSERLTPRVTVLSGPDRVIIDFPEVAWALPMAAAAARGGLIQSFRFGNFGAGQSRMVLDMRSPVMVQNTAVLEPGDGKRFRLVVDIDRKQPPPRQAGPPPANPGPSVGQGPARSALPQVVALPRPPPLPRARTPGDGRHVVTIDAGHGGLDPGAIGKAGTQEKAITLAMARQLKAKMEATGRYRVVLTRDQDIFLPLRDRVAVARAHGADMFISLHADSNPDPRTRGGSVYTLSEVASDHEAELLAAKENKADLIAGMDLSHESPQVASILLDLAQRETMNYSATFAAILVAELGKSTQLLGKSHRFAGFAVLKAPDVPAVLFELGYLSNSAEEKLLNQVDYRRKLADSITRAVDRFFRERVSVGR